MKRTEYRLRVPFRRPYRTSTGTLPAWIMRVVRLEADGATGFGDGDAADELAELDLQARIAGEPALAGASGTVPVNMTLPAGPLEELARDAAAGATAGFGCFKVKVGFGDDVERVVAVRDAIGPESLIRLDANGAWSAAQAIERLDRLRGMGIDLVEQPCATLEELAEVRFASGVPIAADESVRSLEDIRRAAALGACDLVCVKVGPAGGALAARAAIAEARRLGLEPYIASMLDGPWGIAAGLQVAAVERIGRHCGLATLELFDSPLATALPAPAGGRMAVPSGAGLGVDASALEVLFEEPPDQL